MPFPPGKRFLTADARASICEPDAASPTACLRNTCDASKRTSYERCLERSPHIEGTWARCNWRKWTCRAHERELRRNESPQRLNDDFA